MMASLLLAIGGGNAVAQTWEDYTSKITNPSFEADEAKGDLNSGWNSTKGWTITPSSAPKNSQVGIANVNTKIQGIGTTFKPSSGDKFFYLRCNWQKATEFKVSQKLSGELPVGVYKLTCKVAPFSSQGSVTDYKLSLGDGTTTATNKLLNKGSKWREWSVVFYKSDASKDLTIEAYMKPNADGGGNHYCMLLDDFTLSYESVKDYANMCLNADEYKNISGEEKTSLQTAINTGSEEEIFKAVSTFTSAKSAYDNYAEEAAVAEKLGLTVEAPATAAAATEALKTLNVAEYNAATKDYTTAIKLGEWTTTGASKFNNEHWSGETRSYLNQTDANGQGWNSNSWTMTCKQTLTLPAGEYVFKAAGRKSEVAFMKLSVKNGETLVGEVSNFPNGNVGLGITTDGKASFDSNDKFSNNNGRGWQWRFVPFTLDVDTEITFDIEAGADVIHNWASFGDYTVMAKPSVAASIAAYNQAVDDAKAALAVEVNKVVTGEELTNLNAALSADKGKTKETIDAATKKIQECTTAFTAAQPKYQALVDAKTLVQEELAYASKDKYTAFTTSKEATATTAADAETKANAIIAARRAYVESNGKAEGVVVGAEDCTSKVVNPTFTASDGKGSLVGWNRSQSSGNEGALNGETWTNANGTKGGNYYDYWDGENKQRVSQEVANLASGKYIVTIKARAQAGFNLYLLINDEKKVDINEIGNTGGVFDRGWNDYTAEFTVGTDGKVKIEVANMPSSKQAGWFGFGDVRLVRLGNLDVTLDEAKDNTIEAMDANVTLKRSFVANKWNTLVLPFAVSDADVKTTFGADAKVVVYSNADDANINFTTSTKGIEANVPVLIMPVAVNAKNTYTFNGVSIVEAAPKADGTNYSFVGRYEPYDLVNDDYMLYADKWWKTEAGDTYKIKAFRAYIKANTPVAAKQLNLVIDGQTTGLKLNTVNGNIEGETYNIAGQRVANSYKGLIIKNGKKIIKK